MKIVVIRFNKTGVVKACTSQAEAIEFLRENGENYSIKYLDDFFEGRLNEIYAMKWVGKVVEF